MTDPLSSTLTDKISQETYALFPTPVTRYSVANHEDLKRQILLWMKDQDLQENTGREAISHNVTQIGENNAAINEIPDLKDAIQTALQFHNKNAYAYDTELAVNDSYVDLANAGAIYAPHEHSNCIYSLTYFINFDPEKHAFLKFRKNVASNHYPILQLDSDNITAYNLTEATFNMSEGDIIIYPSNLTHGFDSNQTPERITLTANIITI